MKKVQLGLAIIGLGLASSTVFAVQMVQLLLLVKL